MKHTLSVQSFLNKNYQKFCKREIILYIKEFPNRNFLASILLENVASITFRKPPRINLENSRPELQNSRRYRSLLKSAKFIKRRSLTVSCIIKTSNSFHNDLLRKFCGPSKSTIAKRILLLSKREFEIEINHSWSSFSISSHVISSKQYKKQFEKEWKFCFKFIIFSKHFVNWRKIFISDSETFTIQRFDNPTQNVWNQPEH